MLNTKFDGPEATKYLNGDFSGENYRKLLEYLLPICPYFSLINDAPEDEQEEVKKNLDRFSDHFYLKLKNISEWPGTKVDGVYSLGEEESDEIEKVEQHTALIAYKFNKETLDLLYALSDNIWKIEPLNDLIFYKENGEPFLITVTHEWMCWITGDEEEQKALKKALPFIEFSDKFLWEDVNEKYGYESDIQD